MAQFRDRPGDISNAVRSNERRKANDSARRAREQRQAGIDAGTGAVTTVLDAFIPGAGVFLKPGITKGFEALSDLDRGTTIEQQQRIETSRNRNRQRPEEAAALPVIEDGADKPSDESNAARVAKKRKKGTKTVLTSPLGATETARTAIAKLGGY